MSDEQEIAEGDTLFAWQVREGDGRWSMVGALIPETMTHSPLIHRSSGVVRRWEELAHDHAALTGQPLRLARFTLAEVIE